MTVSLLLVAALLAGGCDDAPSVDAAPPPPESLAAKVEEILDTGDLSSVRKRGELRILVSPRDEGYLPRDGSPYASERALAMAFANELGVAARFVPVRGFGNILPALIEGRGDIAAKNLTVTAERRTTVAFTAPVAMAREQLVTRKDDSSLGSIQDLAGRRLAVQRASSFWLTAERIAEQVPEVEIETIPDEFDAEAILQGVESELFDVAIVDSNWMEAARTWHPELRVAFDLSGDRMIAWAMRPDSHALRQAADRFLLRSPRSAQVRSRHHRDLAEIKELGVLRVLTRNSGTTYFIWRGQLMGFEYELVRHFAEKHGLRVEMVVPPTHEDLIPWLLDGRGDIVAAGISASPERATREGVSFTRQYNRVREVVVTRADDPGLVDARDLAGRSFVVRRSSSYWGSLQKLAAHLALEGVGIEIHAAPEELATENIIAEVAAGNFDLTLADSHIVDVELAWRDDIRVAFEVGEPVEHAWALRPDNLELLAALDEHLDHEYRGLFYNMTAQKYFQNQSRMKLHGEESLRGSGRISRWDEMVKQWAAHYGFDWRLVLAQMYQESRFDPGARSFAGARGLLQVMPRTGREHGFTDLIDPEGGLRAGLQYLSWVRDRFASSSVPPEERVWFSLAAYNAGVGHVRDARRIAKQQGWDPNRWFDNVERAMLLKEKPEIYEHTRFGYCRGSEPVRYVRRIHERYEAYLQVMTPAPRTSPLQLASD